LAGAAIGARDERREYTLKVPYELHKLYPALSEEEYERLAKVPSFLNEEIPVCQDCYLELVRTEKLASGLSQLDYLSAE
jgi:hypothetical protein